MEELIFRILRYLLETGRWCIPSGGDNGCFSRKILFLGGRGGGMSVIVILQMPEVSQGHLPDGC